MHAPLLALAPKLLKKKKNIYVAGAKLDGGKLLTAGGRVLGVTEVGADLKSAIAAAYETVKTVKFGNAYYRHDIGARALLAKKG